MIIPSSNFIIIFLELWKWTYPSSKTFLLAMPTSKNRLPTKLTPSFPVTLKPASFPFSNNSPKGQPRNSITITWKNTCFSSITIFNWLTQTTLTSSRLPKNLAKRFSLLTMMSWKKGLHFSLTTGAIPWSNSLLLNFPNLWKDKNACLKKPSKFLTMPKRNSIKSFKAKFRDSST